MAKKKEGVGLVDLATGETLNVGMTPEQVQYVSTTFKEHIALLTPLAEAKDVAKEKKLAYDEAREVVGELEAQESALKDRLMLIAEGKYEPPVETVSFVEE